MQACGKFQRSAVILITKTSALYALNAPVFFSLFAALASIYLFFLRFMTFAVVVGRANFSNIPVCFLFFLLHIVVAPRWLGFPQCA